MVAAKNLPPGLRGTPFTVRQALAAGVGQGRLRRRDLDQPFWGVRAPAGSGASLSGLAAALLTRRPDAVLSHESAAQLWELPLPARLADMHPIHISVDYPRRAPGGAGLVGHQLHLHHLDVRLFGNIRVTTLERTLCDLANRLTDEEFIAAGDNSLWWRRPNTHRATVQSLGETITRFTSRRGVARLVRLAGALSDRADAPPESVFRWRFSRAGLPAAIANKEIYSADGEFLAMPDLQFPDYKIAFDYEGDHHRTDRRQWQKDIRRVPRLQEEGWHHVRGSALDLADSRYLITRLAAILRERGWRG